MKNLFFFSSYEVASGVLALCSNQKNMLNSYDDQGFTPVHLFIRSFNALNDALKQNPEDKNLDRFFSFLK
jgi:hypothetical protein